METKEMAKGCIYPNCFNCKLSDCVNDRLEPADFENNSWDEESRKETPKKSANRRYREKHRKELNEKSKRWHRENAEMVKETKKKWNKENKQRIAAKKRERYAKNPDLYREKTRDYRAMIWENLPHCDECEQCVFVTNQKGTGYRRICVEKMRLIEQKVTSCPHWCRKRRDKGNEIKSMAHSTSADESIPC